MSICPATLTRFGIQFYWTKWPSGYKTHRFSIWLSKYSRRVGRFGVPQGGPFSPLAANIYLNEVDWTFDAIRRKTAQGPYEAVNHHRFTDDIVITSVATTLSVNGPNELCSDSRNSSHRSVWRSTARRRSSLTH